MPELFESLRKDIRFQDGLRSCYNCGTCTAICPAASVSDYDPRMILDIIQGQNPNDLEKLLQSDIIWLCGECLSCKTRCPRGNTPGYVIQALRSLSIETGLFAASAEGRKQLELKRTIGEDILKYGYCVYVDEASNERFPEQGPVWEWLRNNKERVMERLGTAYNKEGAGTLRKISQQSLTDLQKIFDETGASERFSKIELHCARMKQEEAPTENHPE
jgi:heterodisulfide reductase subunit C